MGSQPTGPLCYVAVGDKADSFTVGNRYTLRSSNKQFVVLEDKDQEVVIRFVHELASHTIAKNDLKRETKEITTEPEFPAGFPFCVVP